MESSTDPLAQSPPSHPWEVIILPPPPLLPPLPHLLQFFPFPPPPHHPPPHIPFVRLLRRWSHASVRMPPPPPLSLAHLPLLSLPPPPRLLSLSPPLPHSFLTPPPRHLIFLLLFLPLPPLLLFLLFHPLSPPPLHLLHTFLHLLKKMKFVRPQLYQKVQRESWMSWRSLPSWQWSTAVCTSARRLTNRSRSLPSVVKKTGISGRRQRNLRKYFQLVR
ncbi:hypothetical protein J3Q64DRAFT_1746534 [Phycomyces blakesleeanus]|uniref:Uncharacterized protein n=1 Tax=Phycomyces blakesleeanus TaxID=4837 RepID=A0ABR3AXB1_PHYBL